MPDDDDFSDAWGLFDRQPTPKTKSRLLRQLEAVKLSTQQALQEHVESTRMNLNTETLSEVIALGVRIFVEKLEGALKSYTLVGLLEVTLEGQNLTPFEVKGFIRALPSGLVKKVVNTSIGSVSGVNALMAIEHLHRTGRLKEDYQVLRTPDGRLFLKVSHGEEVIDVFLDDTFEGLPDAR